jgi:hypothetical protein
MESDKKLEGIEGWLLLVGIGVILNPVRLAFGLVTTYSAFFSSGVWEKLTNPVSTDYHPLWSVILISESVISCLLLLAWLYMPILFFKKKKQFPWWFIGILSASFVFSVADNLVISSVLPTGRPLNFLASRETLQAFMVAVIWIPYMLISKRVKATFIN